jgi:hypothetical protein
VWGKRKTPRRSVGGAEDPAIPVVSAGDNPWGVDVFDVRPLTQTRLSLTPSSQMAANAVSYGGEDGRVFLEAEPEADDVSDGVLVYRRDRVLADGPLFLPERMEHKWAIFHGNSRVIFVRSWLRKVMAVADVAQSGDEIHVGPVRGTLLGPDAEPGFTLRVVDYILRSHALREVLPAPLPASPTPDGGAAADYCMSAFGTFACFATSTPIPRSVPARPLRSHSMLHIAVARGDLAEIERLLDASLPIDLLAADGFAPLHWALLSRDTQVFDFLLARGCPVDVRSEEGATALMTEVLSERPAKIEYLLSHGADVNAKDARGFTALHYAAERGKRLEVERLLGAGADPRAVAQGHTPRSLAKLQGHAEIAAMLP